LANGEPKQAKPGYCMQIKSMEWPLVGECRVRSPWLAYFKLTNHNPSSSITLQIIVL
jgi:hypothetical protein